MGKYHYPKNNSSIIPVACSSFICIYNDKYNGSETKKKLFTISKLYTIFEKQ